MHFRDHECACSYKYGLYNFVTFMVGKILLSRDCLASRFSLPGKEIIFASAGGEEGEEAHVMKQYSQSGVRDSRNIGFLLNFIIKHIFWTTCIYPTIVLHFWQKYSATRRD